MPQWVSIFIIHVLEVYKILLVPNRPTPIFLILDLKILKDFRKSAWNLKTFGDPCYNQPVNQCIRNITHNSCSEEMLMSCIDHYIIIIGTYMSLYVITMYVVMELIVLSTPQINNEERRMSCSQLVCLIDNLGF